MGLIRVLSEEVANKIAAGEVIERPSSIVKELIENSLDAGAGRIDVEIRHGGKSLIRVSDSGSGMAPEDAELAFQRHATSKIQSAEDLEAIHSYGFRGEALASIAAVSRVKLMTRRAQDMQGTEIIIEGGKLLSVKPCASAPGTTLEIRDLFFNTPARRKFLKTDATEYGHTLDTFSSMALSRLDVHMTLKSEQASYDLPPAAVLRVRAEELLGEDVRGNLMEFDGREPGFRIYGLIGKPHIARANRLGQTLFVNKRWVKAHAVSYALQAGFHGHLMHGQYPVAVVFLDIDASRIDVNVHPTKQEIKISHENTVKSFLKDLVSKRLAAESSLIPSVAEREKVYPSAGPAYGFSQRDILAGAGAGLAERTEIYDAKSEMTFETPVAIKNGLKITKVLGQIHNTFIIAESEEGLLVIDQHAAHEKVQYEALLKAFESKQAVRQGLLVDEIINLSPRQTEILKEALAFLNRIGFDVEAFGADSFAVRALPSVLAHENPLSLLRAFVEEKEAGKVRTRLEDASSDAAAMIACKRKSVKAHDAMTPEAVKTLVTQLAACDHPFACPHGRPAILKYSFDDLEKLFKRKV